MTAIELPRVRILQGPTPLAPLPGLQSYLFNEARIAPPAQALLWVKRDDAEHAGGIGGNKARKLEFILGEAVERGARRLITPGMLGSNHALTLALAARLHDLRVRLILGPQPITDDVRMKLLAFHALGAELLIQNNLISMGLSMGAAQLRAAITHGDHYVPTGGSSREGAHGYRLAFEELYNQTGRAELPALIYVPYGSGGTAAGLLAGARAMGVSDQVRIEAVRVTAPWMTTRARLNGFARPESRRWDNLDIISGYHQPGYGASTPEVDAIVQLLRETDGIELESTYSGKAMLALVEGVRAKLNATGTIEKTLFWLTYHRHDLEGIIRGYPWRNEHEKWRELPRALWPHYAST